MRDILRLSKKKKFIFTSKYYVKTKIMNFKYLYDLNKKTISNIISFFN